jgi:hypothetical protein
MAGQPVRRAREAERAGATRRAKPVDPGTRARVVAYASAHGSAAAAKQFAVTAATVRKWCQRDRERRAQGEAREPAVVQGAPVLGQDASRAEKLRAAAERERATAVTARDQADSFLAQGDARAARDATVASRGFADLAAELEEASRREEEHEVRISEAQGEAISAVAGAFIEALGLRGPAPRDLWATLLGQAAAGEALQAPEDDVAAVRGQLQAEARAAVMTEIRDREERDGPADADEGEESDDEDDEPTQAARAERPGIVDPGDVTWDDVPDDWRRRFGDLALHEYANALRREAADVVVSTPRQGRYRDQFKGPGWSP